MQNSAALSQTLSPYIFIPQDGRHSSLCSRKGCQDSFTLLKRKKGNLECKIQLHRVKASLRIFLYSRTGGGSAPYAVEEDARIPLHCSKEGREIQNAKFSCTESNPLSVYFLYPKTGGTAPCAVREDARIPLHCSKEGREIQNAKFSCTESNLFPVYFYTIGRDGTAPYAVREDARIPLHC